MPLNLSRIRSYAPKARRDFIAAVANRAAKLGITESGSLDAQASGNVVIIGGHAYPEAVGELRARLLGRIAAEGYREVIEQVAYTWFNRLAALRFMEIHEYLSHPYRVLSAPSDPECRAEPEILKHATQLDFAGLNRAVIEEAELAGNREEEIYRLVLVAQCNALNAAMPFLFEKIGDETELLLPDGLLATDGLIRKLVMSIPESDWQEIEIIGWLYQFYISERKDQLFASLKNNQKVTAENIPAATQLFTPHWVVRYLVENTLGRLWMLNNPNSVIAGKMKYYIAPTGSETEFLRISNPEEIRVCDPACGSGHMLTYAFDLLHEIYEEKGYEAAKIPELILKHNLTGIEIDDRAGTLAAFALAMKAAAKLGRRRFLRIDVKPNIVVLQNVSFTPSEIQDAADLVGQNLFTAEFRETLDQFTQAKNFGSLIAPKQRNPAGTLRAVEARAVDQYDLLRKEAYERVIAVLRMAEALSPIYHVIVANPPYMGAGGMNSQLKKFVADNYAAGKADLMTSFMERLPVLLQRGGMWGMINIPTWMFIKTFEGLREILIQKQRVTSLLHLGRGVFGSDFGTVAFCICSTKPSSGDTGVFRRLFTEHVQVRKPDEIEKLFLKEDFGRFILRQLDLSKLPGLPIVYWASKEIWRLFEEQTTLGELIEAREGLTTGSNDTFMRYWHEPGRESIGFGISSNSEAKNSEKRWFPYVKGGEFRRWYGNLFHVVNWRNDGEELRSFKDEHTGRVRSHNYNDQYGFREGFSWSNVTSGNFSARYTPSGFMFDTKGPMGFTRNRSSPIPQIAYLNSCISSHLLKMLSPTLDFKIGHILNLPVGNQVNALVSERAHSAILLSKFDWDARETSWDFTIPPLLRDEHRACTLEATYANVRAHWQVMTDEMQRLEEENNRFFINAYGLQEELKPDVPVEEITLACNPAYRYGGKMPEVEAESRLREDTVKELISYSVGCLMGRYSLLKPGLVYASAGGEGFDQSAYGAFAADDDGIVPVTDRYWFDNDAAMRFAEFLEVAFERKARDENLAFVAGILSPKRGEAPVDTIRRYLSRSFFKEHLQDYKRRPIYWLFTSGPERAFECLVYLHRYNDRTLARMRAKYVIPLQSKMQNRLESLRVTAGDIRSSAAEKNRLREIDTLQRQMHELSGFDDRLRQVIDQHIRLDLDDGVRINYGKMRVLLAEADAVIGKKADGDDE
ncbi:BREX-1 system adenine-specific DNA-methyltransferase PglX [Methylobacterium oxalidis]|uniref:BREX-1 system adenine-specific DNA-methyltransferase PglX n=1 Tax=Methylobacterium oxalidis TaxID=944322 RepID=UPI003315A0F1